MPAIRTRLPNGFTLVSEESHAAPVVALQAWVRVGSADEPEVLAGVAHVHEHMLFKGTARRGVGEIARTVEAAGGEINAWTSYDQTVYHLVLAAEELGTGLDILADALRASAFDPQELARELLVVVDEIRRADDSPQRRVAKALFLAAYQQHPYRRPVIGSEDSVRALTREAILGFYRAHYRPDRITLIATGHFDTARLVEQVASVFGAWRVEAPYTAVERAQETAAPAVRVRVLAEAVKEARLALAWPIPSVRHADTAALDVLSTVLGHGDSSRLYLETQRRRQLVNHVYSYAYTPRDPGLFIIEAGLPREKVEGALASLLGELYALCHLALAQDEIDKAKTILLSDAAYQRETVQGLSRKLGFYEVVAGDFAFEEQYEGQLRALTAADLAGAAQRYFTAMPTVVVQVPQEGAPVGEKPIAELVASVFAEARAPKVRARRRGPLEVVRAELAQGAVVLARRDASPVVAMRAVALGGLRWEDRAHQGLGNLFASLWGRATAELSMEALAARAAALGGSLGAFSGRNSIGLRGEFVAEHADAGLHLFFAVLTGSQFAADDLERERALVLEQIRNREDNPAVIAFDLFAEALFPTHPYGLKLVGSAETVRAVTLDDVTAYSRTFVSPDKLVLVVVGDVDPERVIDLAAERLLDGTATPLPPPPARDLPIASPRRAQRALDKKQVHLIIGAMGTTVKDRDRHALEVLTTILSGQSGRLFLDLRDKQGLAYALSSSSVEGLDPGYVLVHVGTGPEQMEAARQGVYAHLARVRDDLVTDDELSRAHRYLVGTHAIDLQRAGSRAMVMALGELFGLGYDQYARYGAEIRDVTRERVRDAARTYLSPERLVEVVVGPAPKPLHRFDASLAADRAILTLPDDHKPPAVPPPDGEDEDRD